VNIPGTDEYVDAYKIAFVRHNPAANTVHLILEPDNNQQIGGSVTTAQFKELMQDLSNVVMGRDVEEMDTARKRIGPRPVVTEDADPNKFAGIVKFPPSSVAGREGFEDYIVASKPNLNRLVGDKIVVNCKDGQQWDAENISREQFFDFLKELGVAKKAINSEHMSR
jgi:hypothetical protein